jgi:hypothetical protein
MNDTQHDSESGRTRSEWQRRQAIKPAPPRYIEPTLPERINRLRPSERHELSRLIRSLKLRKIIRRTLAEAFWNGQAQQIASASLDSMQKLRATVKAHESLQSYERALTDSPNTTIYEAHITQSQPTIIEVPR